MAFLLSIERNGDKNLFSIWEYSSKSPHQMADSDDGTVLIDVASKMVITVLCRPNYFLLWLFI